MGKHRTDSGHKKTALLSGAVYRYEGVSDAPLLKNAPDGWEVSSYSLSSPPASFRQAAAALNSSMPSIT
jgi:hypothetical protein